MPASAPSQNVASCGGAAKAAKAAKLAREAAKANGGQELFALVDAGGESVAQLLELLARGADIDYRCAKMEGATTLVNAVIKGDDMAVELLLEKGADPNISASDGSTALMAAALTQNARAARALLNAGADRHARNDEGLGALEELRAAMRQAKEEGGEPTAAQYELEALLQDDR